MRVEYKCIFVKQNHNGFCQKTEFRHHYYNNNKIYKLLILSHSLLSELILTISKYLFYSKKEFINFGFLHEVHYYRVSFVYRFKVNTEIVHDQIRITDVKVSLVYFIVCSLFQFQISFLDFFLQTFSFLYRQLLARSIFYFKKLQVKFKNERSITFCLSYKTLLLQFLSIFFLYLQIGKKLKKIL